jgi:hypothetical protein
MQIVLVAPQTLRYIRLKYPTVEATKRLDTAVVSTRPILF